MTLDQSDQKLKEIECAIHELYICCTDPEEIRKELMKLIEDMIKWCEENK
jgi:hypothetical protein